MQWFWQNAPAKTVAAEPPPGRCPVCSGIEVAAVLDLKTWAISPTGEVIEKHIGHRYACQRCACVYSVSGTGVFRHHPASLPLTPEVREDTPMVEDGGKPLPPHVQRPIPRKAPSV